MGRAWAAGHAHPKSVAAAPRCNSALLLHCNTSRCRPPLLSPLQCSGQQPAQQSNKARSLPPSHTPLTAAPASTNLCSLRHHSQLPQQAMHTTRSHPHAHSQLLQRLLSNHGLVQQHVVEHRAQRVLGGGVVGRHLHGLAAGGQGDGRMIH